MTSRTHTYTTTTTWSGETNRRASHDRGYEIGAEGKPVILGSSDPAFRGDPTRYNPEDLLVASLSACHMLWYLSLCGKAGVVVTGYVDTAEGTMTEGADGGGQFGAVVLRPVITLAAGSDEALADAQHHEAHARCFIAQSVNFPVTVEPRYRVSG